MIYEKRLVQLFFFIQCLILISTTIHAEEAVSFPYDGYAETLHTYVNDQGLVAYQNLKINRSQLDQLVDAMNRLTKDEHAQWKTDEQLAFWINAYNALTLKAIIDHYPIKASLLGSLRFPKNSIRQISGVWDKITFPVMAESMTLNHIEHEIIRTKFQEPRIHFALVCASLGCPLLRNEPYYGNRLNEQLNDQTRKFLSKPDNFKIDRNKNTVYLSSIFQWYGDDFISKYGNHPDFQNHKKSENAVLHFITDYISENDKEFLANFKDSIEYLEYDWSLNEQ